MAGKQWTALILWAGLVTPATAGPYLGEWGWCWHPAPDCPKGEYCALHYWAPSLYKARACVHPANIDQYPPGTCAGAAGIETMRSRCITVPSSPTTPYADPSGYFGRQLVP